MVSAERDNIVQKLKQTQDHLCKLEQQSNVTPDIKTLNAQWNEAYSKQQTDFDGNSDCSDSLLFNSLYFSSKSLFFEAYL